MMLFAVMLAAAGCRQTQPKHEGSEPEVILSTRVGEQHVRVEIARNDAERQRGLMFRQSLEGGRGMIFLWDHPEPMKFWMKNTYIPLDMVFINADKHVIFVEENAEPLTMQTRGPDEDSQFVLEVPGGWARAHGIERGTSVRFKDID